jgi:transcriptional regulator with XRE-family HTH domain
MDVALRISQRLRELGFGQKDLADAAEVTESYVSQLLSRKKVPPAPDRTDLYAKMERRLRLPPGELARLASAQRVAELRRALGDDAAQPLFPEVRALVLRKCNPEKRDAVRAIFEQQPFGELERLVIRKMLEVTKPIAREALDNPRWLRRIARAGGRGYREMRVLVLDFLDTDISAVSIESSATFLKPLIKSWDIDLASFELEIALNRRVRSHLVKRFAFREDEEDPGPLEPGFEQFLADRRLSGDATPGEIDFLRRLRVPDRVPTVLYYYRELQNLRDPLHFLP